MLSNSGGFLGTLAYIYRFMKTGRINVIMPSNHQIRTFKAKYIRYVCREEDEFGLLFHQQHETLRWRNLSHRLEHEAGDQANDSDGSSQNSSINSMQEDAQYETFEITSQDASSSAVLDRSENHWISAVLNTVCAIL